MSVTIRNATTADAEALLQIYAYYVENTAISFEYEVPSMAEFQSRINATLKKYPYIVAEMDGKPVGYAYAGAFRTRRAYAHCCEVSIYVDKGSVGQGIGRCLYRDLEEGLGKMGIENLYACIAVPAEKSQYVDTNSRDFHAHIGYREVGYFHRCGKKFGSYFDMIYMEKCLGTKGDK